MKDKHLSGLKRKAGLVLFLTFLTTMIIVISIALLFEQRRLEKKLNKEIVHQVDNLYTVLETHYEVEKARLATSLRLGLSLINGDTSKTDNYHLADRTTFENQPAADKVKAFTGLDFSIYKKMGNQYVRTVTTIADSSETKKVSKLNTGSEYVERFRMRKNVIGKFFDGKDYIMAYCEPLFDGLVLTGFVCVSKSLYDLPKVKEVYQEKSYYQTGFAYAHDGDGIIIFSSGITEAIIDLSSISHVVRKKTGIYHYEAKGGIDKYRRKTQYFSYFEPYDLYINVVLSNYEMIIQPLQHTVVIMLCCFMLVLVILSVGFNTNINKIIRRINQITYLINNLSEGRSMKQQKYFIDDEIGNIYNALNRLINRLQDSTRFAKAMENGNFDYEFKAYGTDDVLGDSFLSMRESMKKSLEKTRIRRWSSEGNAMLSNIMREYANKLDQLCDPFLLSLVGYMESNQGAIYITKEDKYGKKYLDLIACYAFSRKKFLKNRIYAGDGLVGRAFQEKDTIYLDDIPNDYINITSGLGHALPGHVLIVPLVLNEVTYGMIELASFKSFEKYHIRFLEEIAIALAATVSNRIAALL